MVIPGNVEYVMSHAPEIASALRAGQTTIRPLLKQYHCGYDLLLKAILTRMTKAEYKRICRKRLAKSGIANRFTKGHATWNKGLKGVSFPGSQATHFKKGHLPANHKHVGTIFVRNDKCGKPFRWIKVSGIHQGRHKWVPYARYLWCQSHGPVPAGYFIVHVDGDTLNDDIENHRLVNNREHLALQMARDPGMLKKCRRNAARAATKRHAANRKLKARLAKRTVSTQRQTHAQYVMSHAREIASALRADDTTIAALLKQYHCNHYTLKKAILTQMTYTEYRLICRRHIAHGKAAAEELQRSQVEPAIAQLQGPMVAWWECIGCGYDFPSEPPHSCPKCAGLRFAKIQQKRRNTA